MMIINSLVPGTAQRTLGNLDESKFLIFSLPLSLAGTSLIAVSAAVSTAEVSLDLEKKDGRTYLFQYSGTSSSIADLLMYGGLSLSLYGNLLSAYSSYAAHRDFVDRYGDPFHPKPVTEGRIKFSDAVTAPFRKDNIFSIDVLPMLGLMTLSGVSVEEWQAAGGYFRRDQVDLFGFPVSPAAGLGAQILVSALMTTATAAWEELVYRGVSLEASGAVYSSVSFGLAHLGNMLVPGVSVEDTLLQAMFAGVFGFYAADRVTRRGYAIEKMIALHFWNNLLGMVLGYMADPDSEAGLSIHYRLTM